MNRIAATGRTTAWIAAEDAPLDRLLWPVVRQNAAPNFTLRSVAIVRTVNGAHVEWTYYGGTVRKFRLGEDVVVLASALQD